jgi:hypothetical protein
MNITKVCQLNGKTYSMEIPCTEEQLHAGIDAYRAGALLQNAFSFLNADEREFIKTGTPPHVCEEMFGAGETLKFAPDEIAASRENERYYGTGD